MLDNFNRKDIPQGNWSLIRYLVGLRSDSTSYYCSLLVNCYMPTWATLPVTNIIHRMLNCSLWKNRWILKPQLYHTRWRPWAFFISTASIFDNVSILGLVTSSPMIPPDYPFRFAYESNKSTLEIFASLVHRICKSLKALMNSLRCTFLDNSSHDLLYFTNRQHLVVPVLY